MVVRSTTSRPRARRRWAALLVIVAAAPAACTSDGDDADATTTIASPITTTTAPARDNDGQLKIGIFLPLTGPGAELGEPMIAAVEEAIDAINEAGGVLGRPIESEIVDEGAGTGPNSLLADGVDAIIGPASSNVALSQLSAIVQPATGVVTCSPTATAASLDGYPDNGFFFRTVPSDSLQMAAIAQRVRAQGVSTVSVGFLDDPYGRGLLDPFREAMSGTTTAVDDGSETTPAIVAEVGFRADEDDLSDVVDELLAEGPGVVVILGDVDDGARLLATLDEAPASNSVRRFFVNDAIRTARSAIQGLSSDFRSKLTGVAPLATSPQQDGPPEFFAAHAIDCVNLIALSAIFAGSDDPDLVQVRMAQVGSGGAACRDFEQCRDLLVDEGLDVNYDGVSGPVELSNSGGDPVSGYFESFGFTADGSETDPQVFVFEG
jgi:branched-chain amino acid transport system substrate-binding protein